MTTPRFNAYRRLFAELDLLSDEALAADEKARLRDVAEGLLLTRDDDGDELDELRTTAAVALSLLVGMGRWSDAAADQMWERLLACGPGGELRRAACTPSRTAGGSARTARPSPR